MEVMESEYESRALELRQDASDARKELRQLREAAAGEGKERSALSAALREQVTVHKILAVQGNTYVLHLSLRINAWCQN
jgi:dTDP-4-amino-4,6-dideoxygalactose transaminase